MLPGLTIHNIKKLVDERGFFAEILREDWKEFFGDDKTAQANLSFSYPGMIRAWHRHTKGQVDYLAVIKGAVKICAYDDNEGSKTRGQLWEIIASQEMLQLVRVPGHYWHGTMTLGNKPSLTLYFVTRLYDATDPDEERRAWNDPKILDPRTSKPFDWNKPPYK